MFNIDTRAFTSYAVAAAVALVSTSMVVATATVPVNATAASTISGVA